MNDESPLPPTQDLILDVLAARLRCGERYWTFSSRLKAHLRALADAGLISWEPTSAHGLVRASLTDAGLAATLSPTYNTPVPTLAEGVDSLPVTDDEYWAWMREHGLGHGAGVGTVIGAVRADLRKLAGGR